MLDDGHHRLKALVRMGYKTCWALIYKEANSESQIQYSQ